jgi:hypothetical protein
MELELLKEMTGGLEGTIEERAADFGTASPCGGRL